MNINIDVDIHKINKTDISPDDVLVIKVPIGDYSVDIIHSIFKSFQHCFPDNNCVIVPNDWDIQLYNQKDIGIEPATPDELFKFLNIHNTERNNA